MKVFELIEQLKKMPPEAEVYSHYLGQPQGATDGVWLTRDNDVSIGGAYEQVTQLNHRHANTEHDSTRYLHVGEMLNIPDGLDD